MNGFNLINYKFTSTAPKEINTVADAKSAFNKLLKNDFLKLATFFKVRRRIFKLLLCNVNEDFSIMHMPESLT